MKRCLEIVDVVAEAHAEARLKTGVVTEIKWGWRLMVPEFGHFALILVLSAWRCLHCQH